MKLIIVLSLIAFGYAAKLDRTYLPPPGAATAGGSPGSLSAPGQSFGQQAPGFRGSQSQAGPFGASGPSQAGPVFGGSSSGFGRPGSNQPSGPAGIGNAGSSGFGPESNQPSGPSGFGSNAGSFGRPSGQAVPQAYQPVGTGVQPPSQLGFTQNGPQQPERPQAAADRNAEILRYDNQNDGETFSYHFETSNGISAEESGVATNGVQAQGGFSYTGDDGQFYKITYTADENGYLPQGDHLPTPPPIPDEILRSIEENARAAAAGTQEGAYNPEEDNAPVYNAPSFNQAQRYGGSNGFGPSASAGSSGPQTGFNQGSTQGSAGPSSPQGYGFNQGSTQGSVGPSRPQGSGFNQGSTQGSAGPSRPQGSGFNQGSTQGTAGPSRPQGSGFNQGSTQGSQGFGQGSQTQSAFNGKGNQGFPGQRAQGQTGGQAGYDYSSPQNQGRQPNGNANAIPSGPFKPSGIQNQARPFPGQNQPSGQARPVPGQNQPSGPALNQKQYLAPESQQRQPGNQGSAPQSFNQGPQGPRSQVQGSAQFNQNQIGSGSQPSRGPSNFGQNLPSNQPSQGSPAQRGPQGPQGPRAQGNTQQDGYEYNRPQNAFNAGSQSRPQGPNGSRPQAAFPGSSSQGQPGFPGASSQTAFPGAQGPSAFPGSNRPAAQGPQGFPGSQAPRGQGLGQQPQRPSNQETFGGPRQPPSFSSEEGYKY
ncbi:collagen alpha-2(I) chain-like [Cydia pomonella]|uniref:collagen alpha-2(I) chain-like n=1 Tax=Cydia pomonella TaxID=82600 RepID=UPI002ADD82E3|nr:collagen alpha-2(I) chain-like [Cydia pomonella]